jgi:hypothetical protein
MNGYFSPAVRAAVTVTHAPNRDDNDHDSTGQYLNYYVTANAHDDDNANEHDSTHETISEDASYADMAAANTSYDVFEYIYTHFPQTLSSYAILNAVSSGNLKTVEFLSNDHSSSSSSSSSSFSKSSNYSNALKLTNFVAVDLEWTSECLDLACHFGHLHILRFLRARRPHLNVSKSALTYAAKNGDLETLKYLLTTEPYRFVGGFEDVLLHCLEYPEVVRFLLENDDVGAGGSVGNGCRGMPNAILKAVMEGQRETVGVMLEFSEVFDDGWVRSAMEVAREMGDEGMVRFVCENRGWEF